MRSLPMIRTRAQLICTPPLGLPARVREAVAYLEKSGASEDERPPSV
jgi:hypothetical protein